MGSDHGHLISFLEGSLAPHAREAFDAHLLSCDGCWSAIQEDRRGREATEHLREIAPPALRDRIRLAIEIATQDRADTEPQPRPPRSLLMLGGLLATLMIVTGGWVPTQRQQPGDPAAVAAVLHLARSLSPAGPIAGQVDHRPRTLVVKGQPLGIGHLLLDGQDVVVAFSPHPFPMPMGAQPLTAEKDAPWLATRGSLGLACFTRPVPLLLAGRMPATRLAHLAAQTPLEQLPPGSATDATPWPK